MGCFHELPGYENPAGQRNRYLHVFRAPKTFVGPLMKQIYLVGSGVTGTSNSMTVFFPSCYFIFFLLENFRAK